MWVATPVSDGDAPTDRTEDALRNTSEALPPRSPRPQCLALARYHTGWEQRVVEASHRAREGAPMRVRLVLIATAAITVSAWRLLPWTQDPVAAPASGSARSPEEQSTLQTLVTRGLEQRSALATFVRGRATRRSLRSAHELALSQESERKAGMAVAKTETAWELERVHFAWAGVDRWQVQVADLVSSGQNTWQFATASSIPWQEAVKYPYLNSPARHLLTEICDGDVVCKWDTAANSGVAEGFDASSLPRRVIYVVRSEIALLARAGSEMGTCLTQTAPWQAARREVGGHIEIAMTRQLSTPTHTGTVEIRVDADRGFLPVLIDDFGRERKDPQRGYRHHCEVEDAKEVLDGLWMPTKIVQRSYAYVPGASTTWAWTTWITVDDIQAYDHCAPELLRPMFPLGTVVTDRRQGQGRMFHIGDLAGELDRFRTQRPALEAAEKARAVTDPLSQPLK